MINQTKKLFADKIKEMMKTIPLSQIRVKEICEKCGADRKTFYYHFKDKYDLVAWIFANMVEECVRSSHGVMGVEEATMVLYNMKQDIEFYKNAYSDSSQNALGAYIQQYNVNMYEKILKEYLGVEKLTTELEVAVKFFCYGGLGMTREWIMTNANVSAEQYSAMMHDNMPLLLKEAILNKRV